MRNWEKMYYNVNDNFQLIGQNTKFSKRAAIETQL